MAAKLIKNLDAAAGDELATTSLLAGQAASGAEARKFTVDQIATLAIASSEAFTPSGSGAVARTVQAKLREFVSVTDFGATGDGTTNDAAAIQAAHTASLNVYYPQPSVRYRCNSSIAIRQDTTILGANKQNTKIKFFGDHGFTATASVNGAYDIVVSGLTIEGDGTGTTKHGINIVGDTSNAGRLSLRDLVVTGFSGDGVHVERPIVSELRNIQSSSNGRHGFYIGGDGTSVTVTACYASLNTSDGFYVYRNMAYSSFVACASDENTGNGYHFDGTIASPAQDIGLYGCGAEANLGDNFKFTATQGLTLSSLRVYPDSPAVGGHFINLDGVRNAVLLGIRMAETPAATKYALNLDNMGATQSPTNVRALGCSFASINNNNDAYDDAGEAPEAFIAVDGGVGFANSWVDFGGSQAAAAYFKDPFGQVHLRGTIKSGTIGSTAFTLPAGYRPATSREYGTVSNAAFGHCSIDSSGNVTPAVGNNTYFSLDGIYFRAGA